MFIRVAHLGKYGSRERLKTSEYTPQSEEQVPKYTPQPKDKTLEYTPQLDNKMVKDNFDMEYEHNFQINCGIVFVLPIKYDRVLEVSKTREEYIQEEASNQNPM